MSIADDRLVVALDLSTTAAKALAFDASGDIVGSARSALSSTSRHPGWQEQDARDWWRASCEVLRSLASSIDRARVASLTITHQRETFVCLDEGGEPTRPGILWLDSRPVEQVRALGSPEIHRISGRQPSTTTSLYELAWLQQYEPSAMARTARVGDVHAYLVERLTGQWATSWASADSLGLIDLAAFEYSPALLSLVGLRAGQLPPLVPPGERIAPISDDAARTTGLPSGLPLIAGAGDGQCAVLGAAVVASAEASLNLGTSVTLGLHSDHFRTAQPYRTVASALPGRWVLEAALASGAHSIEWFRREVLRDASPAALEAVEAEAAKVAAGSDGLLFLPYLVRAETPYWDPAARGACVGLRDHHGLAHMYRALLEGIALEQALVLSMIDEEVGMPTTELRVMGGGARSPLWRQVIADACAIDVSVSELHESTALGAAILGAAAVGLEGEADVAATARRMSRGWRCIEPIPEHRESYQRSMRAYGQLYPALAEVFREIERSSTGSRRSGSGAEQTS